MAKSQYTILSMMKDEGHCLIEWVAFHKMIGFDNICVYTNDCSDGTDKMLMRLEEMGQVKHFRNDVPEGKRPQPNCLRLAEKNPDVIDTDWLLVMDVDEFTNIKASNGTVPGLMSVLPPETDAIAITWRFYGSNEITDWNPGLVTEKYNRSAPDKFKQGWGVKTMFRPYQDMKLGIHRPHKKGAKKFPDRVKLLAEQNWVNGSGKPMQTDFKLSGWRSTKPTLGYDLVELNHYAVKSYEAYLLRRFRGNVNNKVDKYNPKYFSLFDRNEEKQTSMQRYIAPLHKCVDLLLQDEKLKSLYDDAMTFHKDRVDRFRKTPDYKQQVTDLVEASELDFKDVDKTGFAHHLPKAVQAQANEMREKGASEDDITAYINAVRTHRKSSTRAGYFEMLEGEKSQESSK